ncbi:MAG TPA: hypothetical protein VJT71_19650 [Pyrinomonadaceae bacterium]|nr:hypothetical protein [Pyrinomonadaceae bacterium]
MPGRRVTVSSIVNRSVVLLILSFAILAVGCGHPPSAPRNTSAGIPFRPKLTYESSNVSVTNTESEPYLDTSVHIYVDGTLYSAQIGRINPGETVTRLLSSLTNERGESFDPGSSRVSELEVRARFGRYAVHKDFPPPRK